MSRLPIPGSDDDVWGTILNDYLEVSHNADGTLQTSAIVYLMLMSVVSLAWVSAVVTHGSGKSSGHRIAWHTAIFYAVAPDVYSKLCRPITQTRMNRS
jgi:hypothetical protein